MRQQSTAFRSHMRVCTWRLGTFLCLATASASPSMAEVGAIRGTVVNGSLGNTPIAGAQVALRARTEGQFIVVEETTADTTGCFEFVELPVDAGIQYIAGANLDDVHYPGPRLELTSENATGNVKIVVYESSPEPNPLVIRQHDIVVRPTAGVLEVEETMLIDNPSAFCYVGLATAQPDHAVTLKLSIPSDFKKVTFEKEFFGRRFVLINEKLQTGIPWPPGQRQLKFTYVTPNNHRDAVWKRGVDLPCENVRLTVISDQPDNVQCNFDSVRSVADGAVTFTAAKPISAARKQIQVQIGRVPTPMIVYGRWAASVLLITLVGGTSYFYHRSAIQK